MAASRRQGNPSLVRRFEGVHGKGSGGSGSPSRNNPTKGIPGDFHILHDLEFEQATQGGTGSSRTPSNKNRMGHGPFDKIKGGV